MIVTNQELTENVEYIKSVSVIGDDFSSIVVPEHTLQFIDPIVQGSHRDLELFSWLSQLLATILQLLSLFVILGYSITHHLLVLLYFFPTFLLILSEFFLNYNSLHLFNNSRRFLNIRRPTRAAWVRAWVSVSMLNVVYSSNVNFAVRLSLAGGLPWTEVFVLLRIVLCIWAYRLRAISSRLFIFCNYNLWGITSWPQPSSGARHPSSWWFSRSVWHSPTAHSCSLGNKRVPRRQLLNNN